MNHDGDTPLQVSAFRKASQLADAMCEYAELMQGHPEHAAALDARDKAIELTMALGRLIAADGNHPVTREDFEALGFVTPPKRER